MIVKPRMAVWYAQPRTTVICAARGSLLSGEGGCVADRLLPQMVCMQVRRVDRKKCSKERNYPWMG